jgi:hypothetical protein
MSEVNITKKFNELVSNTRQKHAHFLAILETNKEFGETLSKAGSAVWEMLCQQGATPFMIGMVVQKSTKKVLAQDGIIKDETKLAINNAICVALTEIGVAREQYIIQLDAFANGVYGEGDEFYYEDEEDIEYVKEELEKSNEARRKRIEDPSFDYDAHRGNVYNPETGTGSVDPVGCVYMAYRSTDITLYDDKFDSSVATIDFYMKALEKLLTTEQIAAAKEAAKAESMKDWLMSVS